MRYLKWLDKYFEEAVLVLFLIVMTLLMGTQVAARYIFNYSLSWSEELTRYIFVWSGFLSISFAAKNNISIRIEQLTMNMKPKMKAIIMAIDYAVEFIFFGYLLPVAWSSFVTTYQSGQVSVALELPMWVIQISPFVGFALVAFRLLQKIWGEIKSIRGKAV